MLRFFEVVGGISAVVIILGAILLVAGIVFWFMITANGKNPFQ